MITRPTLYPRIVDSAAARPAVRCAILLLAAPTLALAASADDVYLVKAGAYYSDNIGRAPSNGQAATTLVLGTQLALADDTGPLQGKIAGDVSLNDYLGTNYSTKLVGSMVGNGFWQMVPNLLSWNGDFSFGQVRRDPLQPAQPGNIENVYTFNTGPQLHLRLGTQGEAELQAFYASTIYQDRPFNNHDVGGRLVLSRLVSPHFRVGIGGTADRNTYENASALATPELDHREAFVRLGISGVRTTLNLDGGVGRLRGGTIDSQETIGRFTATRRLTPYVSAHASYSRDYSSSGTPANLATVQNPGGAVGDLTLLTAGPRLVDSADVGLTVEALLTKVEIGAGHTREKSLLGLFDSRLSDGVSVAVTRRLGARSDAGAFASFTREQITPAILQAQERALGVAASISLGGSLGLDGVLERRMRSGGVNATPYNETVFGLYLRYGKADKFHLPR